MTAVPEHAPFCRDKTDGGACWDECCCTVQGGAPYTSGCPLHDVYTANQASERAVAKLGGIAPEPSLPKLTSVPPIHQLTDEAVPAPATTPEMADEVRAKLDQVPPVTAMPVMHDDAHPEGTFTAAVVSPDGTVQSLKDWVTGTTAEPTEHDAAWFCDTAKALVAGERNADYGDALDNFARTGKLWEVVLGVPVSPEQFALCMILVKLERLTNTIDHTNSWTDIIGYAALGGDVASRPGRNSRAT